MSVATRARAIPRVVLLAVALVVAAALAVGVLVGTIWGSPDYGSSSSTTPNASDIGFSRDMRDHHAQAVEMSLMVREATTDSETRNLALDILLTQQQQMGQMFGWLSSWGVTQTSAEQPLSWATPQSQASSGHHADMSTTNADGDGRMTMPGMASRAQLEALDQRTGRSAERLYLRLMIAHHKAGVAMAEAALTRVSQPYVRRLAQSIVKSQTAELAVLETMLAERASTELP